MIQAVYGVIGKNKSEREESRKLGSEMKKKGKNGTAIGYAGGPSFLSFSL